MDKNTAKGFKAQKVSAPSERVGRWMITFNGLVQGFIEKYPNTRTEVHPYKLFNAVTGQGQVRMGTNMHPAYVKTIGQAMVELTRQPWNR